MADGDGEPGAGEDHDLAGVDDLAGRGDLLVVDVHNGLQDQKEYVAVAFQLGPLVGMDSVLHGEGVQAEGVRDCLELLGGGLVQADPREAARLRVYPLQYLLQAHPAGQPAAVLVQGAVHDRRRQPDGATLVVMLRIHVSAPCTRNV